MALELNAGKVTRRDLFWIEPEQIIVLEDLRGRHKPPGEEAIVEMAMSLFDYGQQQPVACRRVEGNRVRLHAGFTRAAAARLIRTGFTGTDGVERRNPEFRLQCVIQECSDNEAFQRNVVENAHRNNTSSIDDAHNQRRLRDQCGMEDAAIARLYRYGDGSKVGRLRELLDLSENVQDLIHSGAMPIDAALALKKLPPAKRKTAVKAATTDSGKVKASVIKRQVREEHLADKPDAEQPASQESNGTTTKTVPLSMRDVKEFFQDMQKDTDERLQKFAGVMLDWIKGEVGSRALGNAFDKLAAGPKE